MDDDLTTVVDVVPSVVTLTPDPGYLVYNDNQTEHNILRINQHGEPILMIHQDGRVELAPSINLDAVQEMETAALLVIREVVGKVLMGRSIDCSTVQRLAHAVLNNPNERSVLAMLVDALQEEGKL